MCEQFSLINSKYDDLWRRKLIDFKKKMIMISIVLFQARFAEDQTSESIKRRLDCKLT